MKKTAAVLLLGVATFVTYALVSGASYLGSPLLGGLPLGNALAALGLCALAGAALAISPRGTAVRAASLASLLAAIAWLPASIALAGNLELNFSGRYGTTWIALTLATLLAALACLAWALLSKQPRVRPPQPEVQHRGEANPAEIWHEHDRR